MAGVKSLWKQTRPCSSLQVVEHLESDLGVQVQHVAIHKMKYSFQIWSAMMSSKDSEGQVCQSELAKAQLAAFQQEACLCNFSLALPLLHYICACRKVLHNKINFWECHNVCIPGTEAVMKQPSPTTPRRACLAPLPPSSRSSRHITGGNASGTLSLALCQLGAALGGALPSPCCLWQGKMLLLQLWISVRAVEHLIAISCVKAGTPHIGIMR